MTNKAALLTPLSLAAAATLAAVLTPASAMALTFNWSFVSQAQNAGQTISGTISGLVEGANNGTGLTITVDSTPTGQLLGGGWGFVNTANGGDAFTVTGGAVTFADAAFNRAGGDELLFFGGFGGYIPQLANASFNPGWGNNFQPNTFTPADTTPVPEPSAIVGLVGLGLLGFGAKFKKKSA